MAPSSPGAITVAALLLSEPNETAMTAGAVLLISAAASSGTLERALAIPACVWLGRVSYSLYLVHMPIMPACAAWLGGVLPPALTLLLAMGVALMAADIVFKLVERPSNLLSRAAGNMAWLRWTMSDEASSSAYKAATGSDQGFEPAKWPARPPLP